MKKLITLKWLKKVGLISENGSFNAFKDVSYSIRISENQHFKNNLYDTESKYCKLEYQNELRAFYFEKYGKKLKNKPKIELLNIKLTDLIQYQKDQIQLIGIGYENTPESAVNELKIAWIKLKIAIIELFTF